MLARDFVCFRRQACLRNALFQRLELVAIAFVLTGVSRKLLLDRFHLLAQQMLAFGLPHLSLHSGIDIVSHLEHFDSVSQTGKGGPHPSLDVECREERDSFRRGDFHPAGDEIGQVTWPVDRGDVRRELGGNLEQSHDTPYRFSERKEQGVELVVCRLDVMDLVDLSLKKGECRRQALELYP